MNGSHLGKAYSRTQSNIALSSGEAGFYGLVSSASEVLGLVAMSEDFGDKVDAWLVACSGGGRALGKPRVLKQKPLPLLFVKKPQAHRYPSCMWF